MRKKTTQNITFYFESFMVLKVWYIEKLATGLLPDLEWQDETTHFWGHFQSINTFFCDSAPQICPRECGYQSPLNSLLVNRFISILSHVKGATWTTYLRVGIAPGVVSYGSFIFLAVSLNSQRLIKVTKETKVLSMNYWIWIIALRIKNII